MSGRPLYPWLFAVLGVGALVYLLHSRFPWVLTDDDSYYRLILLLCWLLIGGGGMIYVVLQRPVRAIRDLLIWSALFLTLIVGYSYRDLFEDVRRRVSGELMPNSGTANPDGSLSFPAAEDGHFYIEAKVDGTTVLFLVDTGATMVVLAPADAKRIGFDLERLEFSSFAETANGMVRGAPVRLHSFVVENFRLTDLPAEVNEAEMG
ncbi:MAG TPA: TIGR02281 family clan AA aspartic protease, partial [Dongiaceae bacterium]